MKMKNKRSDLLPFAVTLVATMSFFSCAISRRPSAERPEEVPLPKDIKIPITARTLEEEGGIILVSIEIGRP